MISLKGKTVFITGASAGIGLACADIFASAGARLILTARREERLREITESIKKKHNVEAVSYRMDVTDKKDVDSVFNSMPESWKSIDILINNAGLAKGVEKIHEGYAENWEVMIDTNIKGFLYVARAITPGMVERKSGHIINLCSIAGHQVYLGGNIYCATKHAVNALTQAMQIELVDTPIRVTAISPGMVETEFSMVRYNGDEEKAKNVYQGLKPLTAEDIADTALFCATRPPHVNINDVIIMPVNQASAYAVYRN